MDELRDIYDAIVVGGGPAALNGALMLGRSRRSVLVVDVRAPRPPGRRVPRSAGPRWNPACGTHRAWSLT